MNNSGDLLSKSDTDDSKEKIGGRIRLVRKLLSLTQFQFAAKIGLESHLAIYRYEKNLFKPDYLKVQAIAYLGYTTTSWLYTGKVNVELCDALISSINKNTVPKEAIFLLFNTSEKHLSALRDHKISPSPDFVYKYCQACNVPQKERDVLAKYIDPHDSDSSIYWDSVKNRMQPQNKILDEIDHLLKNDVEAQKMVLDLLRSLKKRNTNQQKLILPIEERTT